MQTQWQRKINKTKQKFNQHLFDIWQTTQERPTGSTSIKIVYLPKMQNKFSNVYFHMNYCMSTGYLCMKRDWPGVTFSAIVLWEHTTHHYHDQSENWHTSRKHTCDNWLHTHLSESQDLFKRVHTGAKCFYFFSHINNEHDSKRSANSGTKSRIYSSFTINII